MPNVVQRTWSSADGLGLVADDYAGAEGPARTPVILDLDASLVDIHSENKEGTAANYKRGFGFSPMFCFADATGEALAGLLRPGNATANSIADQLAVLDAAIGQLPARIAAGHHRGDDPGLVRRAVQVRVDSAGCSARLAAEFRARNIGFAVVARTNPQVTAAISRAVADDTRWFPALTQAGDERDGAAVAELTENFRGSTATVLTEYRGLTVAQLKTLRDEDLPQALLRRSELRGRYIQFGKASEQNERARDLRYHERAPQASASR